MFPLRDTVRARSFPVVNSLLIGFNVLVFLLEQYIEVRYGVGGFERFLSLLGLVPARLSLARPLTLVTLVSSAFLHGSWFHLISNMWTLYIFGDNVEDRLGSVRYFLFYMASGIAAGLTHALFASTSSIPTVGASGAIAGVLGAYIVMFPRARVITLVPLFVLPWFVEIRAFFYLGLWFLSQLSSGLLSLGAMGQFGGIAWWAHIGGFIFGLVLALPYIRRKKTAEARWYPDEYWPW